MIAWALLACWLVRAPEDLREDYCRAVAAWQYAQAPVVAIETCENEWICVEQGVWGGGKYDYNRKIITIDRSFAYPPNGRFLVFAHEYGHALGLGHSLSNTSIMRQGWDEPYARNVAEEDLEALRKLKKSP